MKQLTLIGLTLCLLGWVSSAQAEFFFNPAIYKGASELKDNDAGSTTETDTTILAPNFSYRLPSGVYFGATFFNTADKDGDGITSYGPTIGMFRSGFLAAATYHFSTEWDTGSATWKGNGIEVDLGYLLPVTSNFYLGPQFKYFMFQFDESESGGSTSDIDVEYTSYDPYIGLVFLF